MSKMKVQDATRELSRRAAKLLGDVGSVRAQAEKTLAELRKIENGCVQREEAEREEKRREEQQRALSAQSKAWTMPDDVPPAVEEKKAELKEEKKEAPRTEERPVQEERAPQGQRAGAPRPMREGNFQPRTPGQNGPRPMREGNFQPRRARCARATSSRVRRVRMARVRCAKAASSRAAQRVRAAHRAVRSTRMVVRRAVCPVVRRAARAVPWAQGVRQAAAVRRVRS